ncbi:MAG: class II aldolase/adducin family protein [Bacillota bacterium]|nr:class II aldolase/adducin family protein [Bacillota bacterium]
MKALNDLEYISTAAGNRVDYTQGGGGNTSAKIDDTRMAVKASGFQLKQINPTTGFVVVDYKKIKDFYNSDNKSEAESSALLKESVLDFEDLPKLRPSVEAGFHSILKKYVIHVHSVYANILTCSEEGKALIEKIFGELGYKYIIVPYVDPGFTLTCEIAERSKVLGCIPDIIFMENHGMVVTSDDAEKCVELNDAVNNAIIGYFKLDNTFPKVGVAKVNDNEYVSNTDYLKNYIKSNKVAPDLFSEIILYPDQLVYLNGGADKMAIDSETGNITYKATEKEALTIEETLCAYIFVIDKVKSCGLTIQTMGEAGIAFINNWESEKYRKSMAK